MQKLPLSSLTEPIQIFLRQVRDDGAVIVEDAQSGVKYKVTAYRESSPEQRERAWQAIQGMQSQVGESMRQEGVTEQDIDKLLLEDD